MTKALLFLGKIFFLIGLFVINPFIGLAGLCVAGAFKMMAISQARKHAADIVAVDLALRGEKPLSKR